MTRRDCLCRRVHHPHGTEGAYIADRCRCQECRDDHAVKAANRRRQRAYGRWQSYNVPIVGSRRRVEALATLGWSQRELSRRLGWHDDTLDRYFRTSKGSLRRSTAEAISHLYDQLWDTPAPAGNKPERMSVGRTLARAKRLDFPPPLAWDEDTIDDPDAKPLHQYRAKDRTDAVDERREEAGRLTRAGWPAWRIAAELEITERTVFRYIAREGQQQWAS